jgi:multiple sugar transport system substrate-binding protein
MMKSVGRRAVLGLGFCLLIQNLALAQSDQVDRKVLTVAAYPSVDAIIKAALPTWQKLHPDVDVRIVSRQYYDHHTAMTTALSTSSNLPDVMALEVDFVGRFAQGRGLEDLSRPPFNVLQHQSKFVQYAYQQTVNRRGEVIAVPTDIGPGTMLYRADLLKKAGLTEAELTKSWDSYVATGVKIKATTGAYLLAHARDMKDIVIRTGLQPGEGLYFDNRSKALATSPRFRRAFELAKEVREKELDARVNKWSSDWIEGFKRGTIATQMIGAWLAGHLNNWMAPNTRGLWRAAQLPEGAYAAYGGTFYAIPRGSDPENKTIAWEFIKLMTLDRTMQLNAFKSQDSFPALKETYDDPFFEQPIPFLGGQPGRAWWRDATRHITAAIVHKQDAFAEEVIDTELDKVLDYGKDIDSALADAQRLLQQRANR